MIAVAVPAFIYSWREVTTSREESASQESSHSR
jgi:hypothetical protein